MLRVYFDSKVETCTYRAASPHVSTLGPDVTINRSSLIKTGSPGGSPGTLLSSSPHITSNNYSADLSHHLYHHHHLHFGSALDHHDRQHEHQIYSTEHHEPQEHQLSNQNSSSIEAINREIHNTPKSRASIVSVRSIESQGIGTTSSMSLPQVSSDNGDGLAQIVVLCACDPENIIAVPLVEDDKDQQPDETAMNDERMDQNQIRPIIIYEKDPSPVTRLSGCFEEGNQAIQFVTHDLCYNQPECQIKVQSHSHSLHPTNGGVHHESSQSMDQTQSFSQEDHQTQSHNGTPVTRQQQSQPRYTLYQNGRSPNSTLVRNEKKWVIIDHVDSSQPKSTV